MKVQRIADLGDRFFLHFNYMTTKLDLTVIGEIIIGFSNIGH